MIDARRIVPSHDILLLTLDTLRYDVAQLAMEAGRTPVLASLLPGGRWERRHSPGSFTLAAHHAFFAGFLPTPCSPGPHPRLFAAAMAGSQSTTERTCVFDAPDIPAGLRQAGYHTICVGGVGFFNKQTPLGRVLPGLFDESHWSPELGVTHRASTERQVECAVDALRRAGSRRVLLFVNVSALHQPNCMYLDGAEEDSPESQAAALAYVDSCLPPLVDALRRRGPSLCIVCSDHGTAYGEDGHHGHRCGLDVVWTVPYAEFVLPGQAAPAAGESPEAEGGRR